ncbi:MAG TPA: DOPA 4,5-dioxygenase family protein [Caulobacteraceae bacterium]|nr:DOPA 4,5-dioxygenase family protein [Caulobacteraceae bacterium]
MSGGEAPWHAHIYAKDGEGADAENLRSRFTEALSSREIANLQYVGTLAETRVGPHPLPQFEVHFLGDAEPQVRALIKASGLTALIHPLTNDDVADHTRLARWIGEPLALDLSVLDPPGVNQGLVRFGRSDL